MLKAFLEYAAGKITNDAFAQKLDELIARLTEDKRSQDVIRATQDKEYRNKLYEEYLIDQ